MRDLPVPRLRRIFEAAELAVGTLDAEGRILTATTPFAEHWDARADDLVGRHLVGLWPEHRRAEMTAVLVRLVEGVSDVETVDHRSLDDAGRLVVVRTTIGRLPDPTGRTTSLLCTLSDVSGSPRLDRRRPGPVGLVRDDPGRDGVVDADMVGPLLGAALRRSARGGRPLSVLRCRVSPLGDALPPTEAVERMGERMCRRVRPGDHVCRVAPDGFVVLAEDLGDEQDAAGVAYRLLAGALEPVPTRTGEVMLGLTIGVAVGDGATSPTRLLDAADSTLEEALADGIGGFRLVDVRSGLAA